MKCVNCGVKINAEFKVAISSNTCPACGKNIMAQDSLAGFLSLSELLKKYLPGTEVMIVASSIVANFDVKQRFAGTKEVPSVIVNEEGENNTSLDSEKRKLQKLRDEAMAEAKWEAETKEALGEQSEITDQNTAELKSAFDPSSIDYSSILNDDSDINFEDADKILSKMQNRQGSAYNKMLNGSGKVRRGT